MLSDTKKEANT